MTTYSNPYYAPILCKSLRKEFRQSASLSTTAIIVGAPVPSLPRGSVEREGRTRRELSLGNPTIPNVTALSETWLIFSGEATGG
jgi:hypothetical protein